MVLSPAPTATVHRLPATSSTVHWGFFDPRLKPVLTVSSGDLVAIETLTHHAGDAPDLLMDAGITDVFERVTDRGPGPHLLTCPIAVDGARPGDLLQVDILEATPRLPHGSNLAARWGFLYGEIPSNASPSTNSTPKPASAGPCSGTTGPRHRRPTSPARSSTPTRTHDNPRCPASSSPLRPHFGTMGVAPEAPQR